ncbi:hypothetical protein [uncultured Tateyamaria sp.]|uniref:hypothetical protein n=1 Tax=uncultured Tateyamaria sp. TaxID=455651 RepID=UPI002624682A|nr:hypothetical protein [uncultured Tateyamaria sp.]
MHKRLLRKSTASLFLLLSACGLVSRCGTPDPVDEATFSALYTKPADLPDAPLKVYHLGHSLVGPYMPVMLKQLAGEGHGFNSQLGWGSPLEQHWEPDVPINGFDESNGPPAYRDAKEAMVSGEYDAVVLTEAVEIRDTIKYHDPHDYLRKWAAAAWNGNPDARVYLYETWHNLDDSEGWLNRLDLDLERYWEREILKRAQAYGEIDKPIYVIPAGQVMAAFVRKVEAAGGIGPIQDRADLFDDTIHFSHYGGYLVALTHYAVLYGRSPVGLPHQMQLADGSPADDPGPDAARAMQETVWEVVTSYPPSGVKQN